MKKNIEGPAVRLDNSIGIMFPSATERLNPAATRELYSLQLPKLQKGDIVIAGRNFGNPDPAIPDALKGAGVTCIIADSFSRSFYRNCINSGLPPIQCSDALRKISGGETVTIDFNKGEILCHKGVFTFQPYPDIISKILTAGGLVPYTKRALGK